MDRDCPRMHKFKALFIENKISPELEKQQNKRQHSQNETLAKRPTRWGERKQLLVDYTLIALSCTYTHGNGAKLNANTTLLTGVKGHRGQVLDLVASTQSAL